MISDLDIRLDYLKDRDNPSEVFEAMALYIESYRDIGQVITTAIGENTTFDFKLVEVESGSILSKLKLITDKISGCMEKKMFSAGNSLFLDLIDIEVTESEGDVNSLAIRLEKSIDNSNLDKILSPKIDRKNLANALSKLSSANEKLKKDEKVEVSYDSNVYAINTGWRFKGNPKEMFNGSLKKVEITDKLQVKISVNDGLSYWTFRSISMDITFKAYITDKSWLSRYQEGLIMPIGPKDVIHAELQYEIHTPFQDASTSSIKNAKITKIINIDKHRGYQYEF